MLIERAQPLVNVQRFPAFFQARLTEYWILTKPRISVAVLITTAAGFLLASPAILSPETVLPVLLIKWPLLFHTLFGTALTAGGASALNMLLEADSDALMERTKERPIPANRVHPEEAFLLGMAMASVGVVHLALTVNLAASFVSAMSLMIYLALYTPLKKKTVFCTVIGAVSGALPPLLGWSAVKGFLSWEGASLFLILFVWQFPHLFALAWLYRDDYVKAEIKMLPMKDETGSKTALCALVFSSFLLIAGLVPYWIGLTGVFYLSGSIILGSAFLAVSFFFWKRPGRSSAKALFFSSVLYVPLLFGLMVLGR